VTTSGDVCHTDISLPDPDEASGVDINEVDSPEHVDVAHSKQSPVPDAAPLTPSQRTRTVITEKTRWVRPTQRLSRVVVATSVTQVPVKSVNKAAHANNSNKRRRTDELHQLNDGSLPSSVKHTKPSNESNETVTQEEQQ
jgi:hypothetical protein